MTGIVWCNTFIEGAEQLERIEEQYKAMGGNSYVERIVKEINDLPIKR